MIGMVYAFQNVIGVDGQEFALHARLMFGWSSINNSVTEIALLGRNWQRVQ